MNNSPRDQNKHDEHAVTRWIKIHDLLIFFVLTFFITIVGWIPVFLNLPGSDAANILGLWGPALAAIVITALTRGKPGLKDLSRRLLHWRVPARWYLLILFGWPVILILSALVHAQITNQPLSVHLNNWSGFIAYLLGAPVLGFWACEEIGWRGFALPRLLGRWNALFSSILLGTVWACWHLPYYLSPNGLLPDFYPFVVYAISLTILMTWVFNHTQGSIFVATFLHFWVNVYSGFQADKLPLKDPGGEALVQSLFLAGAAVLVVALFGYRTLTRERRSAMPVHLKTLGTDPS